MNEVEKKALIRELGRQRAFGVKKLVRIGGSYAVVVPKIWINFNAVEIDGDYYFKMGVEGNELVLKAITDEDLEGVSIKPKSSAVS